MRRLVLWDVDGTLVQYDGLGWEAFGDAFVALFGRAPLATGRTIQLAGRTDPDIALEFLAMHDIQDGELRLGEFHSALEKALAAKAAAMRERGRALPGAESALAAVQHQPGVAQTLLTGNLRGNAMLKLATFGLDRYVDFGDTPLDVAAGLAAGARIVAVASGGYDLDTLRSAGADVVLEDLRDTEAVLHAILAGN